MQIPPDTLVNIGVGNGIEQVPFGRLSPEDKELYSRAILAKQKQMEQIPEKDAIPYNNNPMPPDINGIPLAVSLTQVSIKDLGDVDSLGLVDPEELSRLGIGVGI
jgi:hypothetical protein